MIITQQAWYVPVAVRQKNRGNEQMLSSEDTGYGTSGSIIRAARAANRRELIKNKQRSPNDRRKKSLENQHIGALNTFQSMLDPEQV